MENKIIQSQEIKSDNQLLGNKTINLKKCLDLGFCVPKFIALPADCCKDLFEKEDYRNEVVQGIIKTFPR